jgi:DNA-binding XRE family transcriptional regulator
MNNVRRTRRDRELSQYQIARDAEISQATLSLVERGFKDPSKETKRRIAKALKCRVSEVFPNDDLEVKK